MNKEDRKHIHKNLKSKDMKKQYIDKAVLVAEIEKLISNGQVKLQEAQECNDNESYVAWSEHIATCIKILSFLNTLDVLTLDDIKEMENQAFMHGIEVERNENIFKDNKEIKI